MKHHVPSSAAMDTPTPEPRFGRGELKPGAWRRFLALARRAYGPLAVYAVLGIALIAALTIRIASWLPMVWR